MNRIMDIAFINKLNIQVYCMYILYKSLYKLDENQLPLIKLITVFN